MKADATLEAIFQQDIIAQMQSHGWQVGSPQGYNREKALYEQDVLTFVQSTQAKEWQKFQNIFPNDTERHFLDTVVAQLKKADINATDIESRSYGTLGVLRHGLKTRGTRFTFCQFKPEHGLNPELNANYQQNICRVVPELVYSPYATQAELEATGKQAKKWRIDLVLFINGFPVATMELKSEFKQAVHNAMTQYKKTRLPKDPETNKPEPLFSFKRGALVHFAVSQYEVYMATHLNGDSTYFLPFNKGTKAQGAGNDVPDDVNEYATGYLWNEVLTPDSLLNIVGNFIHLQIEEKEDWEGRKYKRESLIFPRYHQWKVVTKLVEDSLKEGTGQKYLIQHSAGSGKSNSIAWTAHQLSSLYDANNHKMFDSVIVVTDRTILDAQLQDTIYQFEHADGVVGRINNKEGDGSKSEKLAKALEMAQPIIIVTIQTFPWLLRSIENSASLKERKYAVIADEAHSSQSGSTARQLKETLMLEEREEDDQLTSEDVLDAVMASRKGSQNLSFYAFTATPKDKTLQLFGRLPNPELPPSKSNKPEAYHVYSMRQAIEEGFILDVLKNYTNYKVIYKLKQKIEEKDDQVDAKRAKVKLNQWVRLHDHNISQKVRVIIEHFKKNIMGLLGGQAKAMVVTSSRKEAVRYKQAFDKYITEQKYTHIQAMVAFSGEVEFTENDADSSHLLGQKFTESNMNPNLKGREMRKAFDSDDFQVMIVANKFQTGFDQPKLCAMYVDKKLGGVECVQTLSRLNRTYPGKAESGTFVLDFFNEPQDILDAFQPYYQTAELADVSNPDQIYDLFEKLKAARIFLWNEVEQFVEAFYSKNKSNAALANICKPALQRWQQRYSAAVNDYDVTKNRLERCKQTGDAVLIANAENEFAEAKKARDALEIFKKDLGSFTRFYEFMSQIVEYDDKELEKLSLFARNLRPLLREQVADEDEIDLSNVAMSHYRLSKIRQQDIQLKADSTEHKLEPANDMGTAKAKDKKEDFLSVILGRVNELFITDKLTDQDMINYVHTVADKMSENTRMMKQIQNNTREQAMLGEFDSALDDAVLDSNAAHMEQMTQLMSDPAKMRQFAHIIYDVLVSKERQVF
ncbi:restriction endonuclease subunit R [Acinetobacter baumannii]|uniref:type I restriction endonuclease subunit R n=1 Tax=Acinetobacter baumannii TaxID=470 RepID=UPI000D3B1CF7|nr:DEAD/DEAH box helicase family protein [Acinetobacter baumannii]PUV01037.1 restriction endonuclease subunit R [Acinetobacter baumannii]HEE6638200.1 type I restriction endonuclease subunit R [Acinetobacter baumannii]